MLYKECIDCVIYNMKKHQIQFCEHSNNFGASDIQSPKLKTGYRYKNQF